MFLKNEKIFFRKISDSGKGLGFLLYNSYIREIPNPYQNLKISEKIFSHFSKSFFVDEKKKVEKKIGT